MLRTVFLAVRRVCLNVNDELKGRVAPHLALQFWWQIWWQIWGVRGIRGDASAYAHQQLADSLQSPPDFESLSLRQFFAQR
jgi:hypothetical protein